MRVPHQPEINIGMVGHVDHGKTTLTERLSGEWTDRHSEEVKRGISIRLGYADTAVFKCPTCDAPKCYGVSKTCPHCGAECELLRAISFVDSPGHETLMATMLSGAAIMDGALLLIAATEPCPQLQTKEHLMALEISGVKNIVIVQNKIDLVTPEDAKKNYEDIKAFVAGTCAENAPIIPISAHHEMNIDYLLQTIEEELPSPEYDETKPARMYIARSFDVNKPGTRPDDIMGGVIGGSLIRGVLKIGDEIEVRPGRKISEYGRLKYKNIYAVVSSLVSGQREHTEVRPGGLVGIGTTLDPYYSKSDSLTGTMAGIPGTLPPMLESVTVEVNLLEYVIGSAEDIKVEDIKVNEPLMLSVGTATTVGIITSVINDTAEIRLKLPICAESGQRMAMSRRIEGRWRLIGYSLIQ